MGPKRLMPLMGVFLLTCPQKSRCVTLFTLELNYFHISVSNWYLPVELSVQPGEVGDRSSSQDNTVT